MFRPLRLLMIAIWVACVTGTAVVVFLSLEWVTWIAFAAAGVLGLVIGVPAGIWSARAIKRDDPNWPPKRRRVPRKTGS